MSALGAGIATFSAAGVISSTATTGAGSVALTESGTWTPSQGAGLTVVGTFSSSGTYVKTGKVVTLRGRIAGSTSIASGTSNVFTTIPFHTLDKTYGVIASNASFTVTAIQLAWRTSIYCVNAVSATAAIDFSITFII